MQQNLSKTGKIAALRWWIFLGQQTMRISYLVFSVPVIVWLASDTNLKQLGDALSVNFWIKIFGAVLFVFFIFLAPLFIQFRIERIFSAGERQMFKNHLQPLPIDAPIIVYLLGLMLLPLAITHVWVATLVGTALIGMDEWYIRKQNNFLQLISKT